MTDTFRNEVVGNLQHGKGKAEGQPSETSFLAVLFLVSLILETFKNKFNNSGTRVSEFLLICDF